MERRSFANYIKQAVNNRTSYMFVKYWGKVVDESFDGHFMNIEVQVRPKTEREMAKMKSKNQSTPPQ